MKNTKVVFSRLLLAKLTISAVLIAVTPPAFSQAPSCPVVVGTSKVEGAIAEKTKVASQVETVKSAKPSLESLEANYKKRTKILADRYPDLAFVFKDPDAFYENVRQRFEAQKKITPEDPRQFDFPEAATTMRQIREDLQKFRDDVVAEMQKQETTIGNRVSQAVLGKKSKKTEVLNKVVQYVDKLQGDIDKMVSSNTYPYRDTIYTLYYYSRIRGFFQFKGLGAYYQVAKFIDMSMHGYRRLNIDQELRLYEQKGSPIVQVRSGRIATEFRMAEVPFREAFERTDKLEYVVIPSVYALGSTAFMHVLPHRIHIFGASNTPVPADGFNRPGGLFWMHDVRHEADRYMKINSYRKAQNLTSKQDRELTLLMHQWHADFLAMKNTIKDENLKAAVEHYHFYTHHDIGVPLIPSMFLNHHRGGLNVYYAFLYHKKWAGQTPAFKDWFNTTKQVHEVLEKFWNERLPAEKALLQKDPVHIKSWEEWFPMSHKPVTQVALMNKAIESKSLVRLQTGAVGVDGVLTKVIYDAHGNPIHLTFSGETQIVDRIGKVLPEQGPDVHYQGYSSPIGPIKTITIDGRTATLKDLQVGQQVEFLYESGIRMAGKLKVVTEDLMTKQPIVLTFSTAEVKLNDKVLYKPEWGPFDLIIGNGIQSVEFLM